MCKKSSKQRNDRLAREIAAAKPKRDALKETIRQRYKQIETATGKEYDELIAKNDADQIRLDKMSRDTSSKRYRNRCSLTGRPRAYTRLLGTCRNEFRRLLMSGKVPGFTKSSWG